MLVPQPGACDSWLLSADNRIDYLVVTSRALESAAEELATYRQSQGLKAGVAVFEEICDIFANGLRTPEAIPAMLQYAEEHWAEAPWLVVLAGDGHFDYRHAQHTTVNHLPPLLKSTPRGLFAADGLLTDLSGNGLPDIAVGRLPARTPEELLVMVGKIQGYEASHSAKWHSEWVLAADEVDGAGDYVQDSERIANIAAGRRKVERIYLDHIPAHAAHNQLTAAMKSGAGIVHYTGHGGPDNLSNKNLLRRSHVNGLGNPRHPVFVGLTCLVGRFESPAVESLGEVLLRHPSNGAVAVWGPSGLSRHGPSADLGAAFTQTVLNEGTGTLGPAILRAQRAVPRGNHDDYTLATYNLLGDPALKLGGIAEGGHADDDRFAQWRWERFTPDQLADESMSGSGAFPDDESDWSNLALYAFGGTPGGMIPSGAREVSAELDGDDIIISWHQRRAARDLQYRISTATDLPGDWTPYPPGLQIIAVEQVPESVLDRLTARLPFWGDRLFIRLEAHGM